MRTSRLLAAWSLALSLSWSASAFAQPDQARRDAEARFREGLTRVQSNDFEGARLAFTQAYSVLKSTDVLWNLALSEMKSNHVLEALGHFKEYVKDMRVTEPERAKALKYIDDLHARVGRVAIDAPAGATLLVDGKVLAQQAPLSQPVDVSPGEHLVEARLGDRSRLLRAHAPAGAMVALQFRADELTAGGNATAVNVAGAPAAGSASPASSGASASSGSGVTSPPDERAPSDKTRLIVAGSVVGAGVLAGVGAIVFAVSSSSSADDAAAILKDAPRNTCASPTRPAQCSALDDARQSEVSKQNVALGLGVAAGVLVVGGVATYFLWPKEQRATTASTAGADARRVQIAPMFGATNGAMMTGSF